MKAFSIVIRDHEISEKAFKVLQQSSARVRNSFIVDRFDAVTPDNVEKLMFDHGVKWNYPWSGQQADFSTGLIKTAYTTKNPLSRMACFMSHYLLWKQCVEENENFLVLEHDAEFLAQIDFDPSDTKYGIIGINNPLGATRRAQQYYQTIQNSSEKFQPVPSVDTDIKVPQGLAGNSAYIIKPKYIKQVIEKVDEVGAWPNDALMCKQLFSFLGVTKKYYTKIQGLPSTTTL